MNFQELLVHLLQKKTCALEGYFGSGIEWFVVGAGGGGEGGFCHGDGWCWGRV
jgi:hypothetical protein